MSESQPCDSPQTCPQPVDPDHQLKRRVASPRPRRRSSVAAAQPYGPHSTLYRGPSERLAAVGATVQTARPPQRRRSLSRREVLQVSRVTRVVAGCKPIAEATAYSPLPAEGMKRARLGTDLRVAPAARGLAVSGAAARPTSQIGRCGAWVRRTGRIAPWRGQPHHPCSGVAPLLSGQTPRDAALTRPG